MMNVSVMAGRMQVVEFLVDGNSLEIVVNRWCKEHPSFEVLNIQYVLLPNVGVLLPDASGSKLDRLPVIHGVLITYRTGARECHPAS
ncbi:MAG: hypothetical protein Q8P01_02565 [bacterium]|nr:hypothetical protein [bacterium]